MKKIISATILSVILGVFCITNCSTAATVTPNVGTWYKFSFDDANSTSNNNYVFTITETMSFFVTDAYQIGDQFEVFDGTTSLGLTSYVATSTGGEINPNSSQEKVQSAYDSGLYSTGEFVLTAGTYDISLLTVLSPYSTGGAYVKLDTCSVPVPSALLILTAGVLGIAGAGRKKVA